MSNPLNIRVHRINQNKPNFTGHLFLLGAVVDSLIKTMILIESIKFQRYDGQEDNYLPHQSNIYVKPQLVTTTGLYGLIATAGKAYFFRCRIENNNAFHFL